MSDVDTGKDRFKKQMDVILKLLDGDSHTAGELSEIYGTSVRNLYYFLKQLPECGFDVIHAHRKYYISPRSPFFRQVFELVNFTEQEAAYMHGLLGATSGTNPMSGVLQRKLERFFGVSYLSGVKFQRQQYLNIRALEKAVRHKQVVVLHDYRSSHSQSVSDRIIEPYLFLGDKTDVRAYEMKSRQNKTFKISRIGQVEVMDVPWFNEDKHRDVFTDMFLFSGEERHHVKLHFDFLAHNLMEEELPHSTRYFTQVDDQNWIFETDLVRFEGIARFILGLMPHIKIIESDELRQYIRKRIDESSQLLG
ncbi:MAG: helix-turn-helix transcriptional regulator [Prevotella sp.]|jgi:predicted DNA-binding transcriptional regulator YafY